MLSNYPPGVTGNEPEIAGYEGCEGCPCDEPETPEGISASGEICSHPDVCGCDQCECECHIIDDDGEARYEEMLDREEWRRSDPDYGFSAYD